MTIENALRAISNYPIPRNVIEVAGVTGSLNLTNAAEVGTLQSLGYLKASRHIVMFLLRAPSGISEQGVSFSVSDDEKSELRSLLSSLNSDIEAAELAEGGTSATQRPNIGYWGS